MSAPGYTNPWCWRCNGTRIIYARSDANKERPWVCPVCDPNLLPDVYTSRHKINPVPSSETT